MAKTKQQKKEALQAYETKVKDSSAMLFLRPAGLSASEAVALKKELYTVGASYNVVKNTLFKLALENTKMPEVENLLSGVNAIVFCGEDAAAAAKIMKKHIADLEDKLVASVGIYDGNLISESQVQELADMPSLEVIIAQIAGVLTNSVSGVANVLQNSMQSVVYVLDQAFTE